MTIKHCHELTSWSRPDTEPSDVGLVACMHRCPAHAPAQSRSISCSTRIDKRITRPTGKPCRWRRNRTLLEPRGIKRDTRVSSARGSGLPLSANLVSIPKGARTRRFGRTIANCTLPVTGRQGALGARLCRSSSQRCRLRVCPTGIYSDRITCRFIELGRCDRETS
jgi:hypothetical protein